MTYDIAPLLPLWLIGVLIGGLLVTSLMRVRMGVMAATLRTLAALAAGLFLLGLENVQQQFDPLPDQALIVLDDSASMQLGARPELRDAAAEKLEAQLEPMDIEVVTTRFGDAETSNLAEGLTDALASVDRRQVSGLFVLTDGQLTGVDEGLAKKLPAPLHGLLVGNTDQEQDRQLTWAATPRYALVDEPLRLQFRIDDTERTSLLPLTLRIDGETVLSQNVPTGENVTVEVPVSRPGERVIELSVPTAADELSTRNNSITARVNVIRDRLRVLLISGEPHAGERVWRNVLKSDPAVDLVHFTILKPADKVAAASEQELNLIPFPSRELFLEKLKHFNVVIFDRYTYRGVISSFELAEVARYVEDGGAVLVAAGPELALEGSLAAQPNLNYILPAVPTGVASEEAFVPQRSTLGQRHPITAPLQGAEDWGRWLRRIPALARRGQVLMEAGEDAPLLVTQRAGEGRIAMLLSDHLWLWARGFDGGGPHREFLRRLVHWLMAEPELEEESLSATLDEDSTLTISRRSLSDEVAPVKVFAGRASPIDVTLNDQGDGLFTGTVTSLDADLLRLETEQANGQKLTAAAVRERGASQEQSAVTVSANPLNTLTEHTGGGLFPVKTLNGANFDVRTVRPGRTTLAGRNWAGLTPRNARAVTAETRNDALPRWAYALGAAGFLFAAWLTESGRLSRHRTPM